MQPVTNRCFQVVLLMMSICGLLPLAVQGHDTHGRAHAEEDENRFEFQSDLFLGRRGYRHFGLSLAYSLDKTTRVGIGGHAVREDADAETFPSLGAEYSTELNGGVEAEFFSFGYFPVEQQRALAVGSRVSKSFQLNGAHSISPFGGLTLASIRAGHEQTQHSLEIQHLMLLGGVTWRRNPFEASFFASHSFYSRSPRHLETRVDLEEMTHLAVYGNTDGLPYKSAGLHLAWSASDRLVFSGNYAALHFEDLKTRHAALFTCTVGIIKNWSVFAGLQVLRGGDRDNDLFATGVFWRF